MKHLRDSEQLNTQLVDGPVDLLVSQVVRDRMTSEVYPASAVVNV